MKFETKIYLFNKKLDEMDIPQEDKEVNCTLDTIDIEGVAQRYNDNDELDEINCLIYTKSGNSYVIKTPYKKMLQMWGRPKEVIVELDEEMKACEKEIDNYMREEQGINNYSKKQKPPYTPF